MLEVHGRDARGTGYHVRVDRGARRITGLVPDSLIGGPALGSPRHQHAYEWLALNKTRIEAALSAKIEGRPVRAPFDCVELAEEK